MAAILGIFELVSGYKTYFAAAGLAGLAVYQVSQGDLTAAYQSVMAALATVGIRHAVAKASA